MRTVIWIGIVLIALLTILCYSLMVTAHEADERAERMYRKWKEQNDERDRQIPER